MLSPTPTLLLLLLLSRFVDDVVEAFDLILHRVRKQIVMNRQPDPTAGGRSSLCARPVRICAPIYPFPAPAVSPSRA